MQQSAFAFMGFNGFGPLLLYGTWLTLKLALFSLCLSLILGVVGAQAKLSTVRILRTCAQIYTTLIRGVPDLVLMLLIFYGLQSAVSQVTTRMGWAYMDIDAFSAGVITLGFIYGAYFTETFRGALLAIPPGQIEAGRAFGMTPAQCFCQVIFPQMMHFALPGLGNNWLVLLKATALVSIIGLADLVKVANDAGKSSYQLFYFLLLAALIYLLIAMASNVILYLLECRFGRGVRGPQT